MRLSQRTYRNPDLVRVFEAWFDLPAAIRAGILAMVEAAYSKHRRRDVLPLRDDVVAALREYLGAGGRTSRSGRVWPRSWYRASARMLRIDLEAAGIPYQDEGGHVFDFHALRHQFISNLARAGVHPKAAQALARHSTITLTLDRYTHVDLPDLSSALDRLPAIGCSE